MHGVGTGGLVVTVCVMQLVEGGEREREREGERGRERLKGERIKNKGVDIQVSPIAIYRLPYTPSPLSLTLSRD